MKKIRFTAYFCGMSDELFSDNIMIYRPFGSYEKIYCYGQDIASDAKVSALIESFKADAQTADNALGDWGDENLQVDTVYIRTEDALLGLQKDKLLSEMFSYFSYNELDICYICVIGGASFWCDGYQFIVHPNEDIHRYHPHVHVRRDSKETRYCLDTLTRFPGDSFSREFKRDEKKTIIPYLQKNQAKLRRYWDYYMNGYIPPIEDEKGMQFYSES